ncbi:uncharacterized protein LOC115996524 [Ipomoea triloba]|uniref:uncharacterized protein LOC115996524 n=1 Tax=Ipomoea triloba TaxID=35885 RepID=UPI00125CF5F5|nr:uncharacterized protein LOC115996524 [Ipomoea triloba]
MAEFQYAYFNSEAAAIVQIKIPTTLNTPFEPEVKLVFSNPSKPPLPSGMGVFSHNHILYMVGGYNTRKFKGTGNNRREVKDDDDAYGCIFGYEYEYDDRVHMFDPTKCHQIPVENIETLQNLGCAHTVLPKVIRAEDRIYLLSRKDDHFGYRIWSSKEHLDENVPLDFQYFDLNKKLFETLPSPPIRINLEMHLSVIGVKGYFFLRGYIYVFITDTTTCFETFKFSTKDSKWEDCKSFVDRFEERNIPFPFLHAGDMGVSDEFDDNTWILVSLHGKLPTAYRVRLSDTGDIDPISHRVLAEFKFSDADMPYSVHDWKQLADMGGERFCVMHTTSSGDFFIYVFEINFRLEHAIQTFESGDRSSNIIFSMKFNPYDTLPKGHVLTGFCIASAPLPASPDNEDQDKTPPRASPDNADQEDQNSSSCATELAVKTTII